MAIEVNGITGAITGADISALSIMPNGGTVPVTAAQVAQTSAQAQQDADAAAAAAQAANNAVTTKAPINVIAPVGASTLALTSRIGNEPIFSLNDLIPEIHLSNLCGNLAPVIGFISDSTGTPGDSSNGDPNAVDPSQLRWAALKATLRAANPQATFNFDLPANAATPITGPSGGDFSIGGSGWPHVLETGVQLAAFNFGPWFSNLNLTWLANALQYGLDLLFIGHGINYPDQGSVTVPASQTSLFQIDAICKAICASTGTRIPNLIFLTNSVINPNVTNIGSGNLGGGPLAPIVPYEYYKANASAVRTFCLSRGAGFTQNYPNPRLKQFGLIDTGRLYCARVIGKDYRNQFLIAQPTSVQNGLSLSMTPVQIGTSTDGDWAATLVFPGQGGFVMEGTNGVSQLIIFTNVFHGGGLRLNFSGSHAFFMTWDPVFNTSGHQLVSPTLAALPAGDLTIQISMRLEQLTVFVNSAPFWQITVSRYICGGPITIQTSTVPTIDPTMNVTKFYEGFGTQTPIGYTYDYAWGGYGNTSEATSGGPGGGNGLNHDASWLIAAIAYQAIGASRLNAPKGNPFGDIVQLASPASGATVQMNDCTGTLAIEGTGTLAALTINLPVQPTSNQSIRIISQVPITALTITTPAGFTIINAPAGAAVSAGTWINRQCLGTVWS